MATGEKITISVIKADIGGWPGHSRVHPPQLVETAEEVLAGAKEKGTIIDFYVATCGDDLQLIMTHGKGVDSPPEIHGLAWKAFEEATKVARGGSASTVPARTCSRTPSAAT